MAPSTASASIDLRDIGILNRKPVIRALAGSWWVSMTQRSKDEMTRRDEELPHDGMPRDPQLPVRSTTDPELRALRLEKKERDEEAEAEAEDDRMRALMRGVMREMLDADSHSHDAPVVVVSASQPALPAVPVRQPSQMATDAAHFARALPKPALVILSFAVLIWIAFKYGVM